jgi:hypothetical protein
MKEIYRAVIHGTEFTADTLPELSIELTIHLDKLDRLKQLHRGAEIKITKLEVEA